MSTSLRLTCRTVRGSTGKAMTLHVPPVFTRLAEEGKDYVHIIVRADLNQIILGYVRGSDMGYKLKKDKTLISRRVQDELGFKIGQRVELELVSIDEATGRAVFEGDEKWFRSRSFS